MPFCGPRLGGDLTGQAKTKMESVLSLLEIPTYQSNHWREFWRGFFEHLHDHFIPHARNNYHPHLLGHRALALLSALLVAVKIFLLATVSFGPALPAYSSAITVENIISLTNQSRQEFNLQALTQNVQLDKAAQAKAQDMLQKGYFSHTTPDGKTPWIFIEAAGYNYLAAGENLAVNFTQAEDVETAWMNSPGHKANILNRDFEEIGIGVSSGAFQGHEATIVVQMFGVPAQQKIALTSQPTKVQAEAVPKPAAENPAQKVAQPPTVIGQMEEAKNPTAPAASRQPLALSEPTLTTQDEQLLIDVRTSPNAVRVIAAFGPKAVMLSPMPDNLWQGEIALAVLAQGNASVVIKAFDIQGNDQQTQIAYFSHSIADNYNILGAADPPRASFLGKIFNPQAFEQNFYLLFMALMLVSLILAIAIHRHVQHLSLVANSSLVIVLAAMLWLGG
jgi:hypothetical protein